MMASVRFTCDWPAWFVISGALVAALMVMLYYLRETRWLDSPYAYVLPGLRGSAVALTLLILAGPVWHRRTTIGTLGEVVFAIDTSKSMSITDTNESTNTRNRMVRALELLTGKDGQLGWIEQLETTHRVKVIAFDSGMPSILHQSSSNSQNPVGFSALQPVGRATDLAAPLDSVLAELSSNRDNFSRSSENQSPVSRRATRTALVVLSDGRSTKRSSPAVAARRLRSLGGVVHAIGMGSQESPSDIGITTVRYPETVSSDGNLVGTIVVGQTGFAGQPVEVRIERNDGKPLWTKRLLTGSSKQTRVDFSIDVAAAIKPSAAPTNRSVERPTVVMDLRATVIPVGNNLVADRVSENNAFPFRVAASTRNRKLLIVDGSSRWETRYLRNLFERDPSWTVDTVLTGSGTDSPTMRRGNRRGQFPASIETISRYDAVILGEVPIDQFQTFDAKLLTQYVKRGGGLIAIDGRYDRMRPLIEQRLAELIPVRHEDNKILLPRSFRPTVLGQDQPTMNLSNDPDQIAQTWSQLPVPEGMIRVKPQPGAEVWCQVTDDTGRPVPWLVTRLYGGGRVFYLASGETWRWRYKVADLIHAKFWNQLLIAAMQPPYAASDQFASIGTDKIEYNSSDSVTIRAKLQSSDGTPIADATVDAIVVSENQVAKTIAMSVADMARGTYVAQTSNLEPGRYEIRLRASGFDSQSLRAWTPIWIGDQATKEWQQTGLDEQALEYIATAGGGRYYHESSAQALLDQLKPLSSGQIVETDIVIWQSFYWFWAIVGLLAAEWIGRKRSGLI